MPIVPPGCETGLYYIILAGLHWEATWQDVRDELRGMPEPCEVDYVEVFKGTGNGWVRIVGEKDAERAHEYLNGHYMMGVHLISHFKNRYDPVMLRDSITEGSEDHDTRRHSRHRRIAAREQPALLPPVGYGQQQVTPRPLHSELQQSSDQPRADPILQSYQYSMQSNFLCQPIYDNAYTQLQAGGGQFVYVTCPQQDIVPLCMYQPPVPPISPNQLAESTTEISPRGIPETPIFVSLAARKIIIKNLPRKMKNEAIARILQDAITPDGSPSNAIQTLDIPLHSNGNKRGHAIALLATERMAYNACEILNGMTLEGRQLRVTLTKEGVTIPGSTAHEGSAEGEGSVRREMESPLVVNGSIRGEKSRSESQSSNGKERGKKRR